MGARVFYTTNFHLFDIIPPFKVMILIPNIKYFIFEVGLTTSIPIIRYKYIGTRNVSQYLDHSMSK
jgi:hypothetical protein